MRLTFKLLNPEDVIREKESESGRESQGDGESGEDIERRRTQKRENSLRVWVTVCSETVKQNDSAELLFEMTASMSIPM